MAAHMQALVSPAALSLVIADQGGVSPYPSPGAKDAGSSKPALSDSVVSPCRLVEAPRHDRCWRICGFSLPPSPSRLKGPVGRGEIHRRARGERGGSYYLPSFPSVSSANSAVNFELSCKAARRACGDLCFSV